MAVEEKAKLDLSRIKFDRLNTSQYYKQSFPKKQIYLHHTVSHPSQTGDVNSWRNTSYRIGTAIIVAGKPYKRDKHTDGDIFQCFSSSYWAYHLASHGRYNRIPSKYKTRTNTRMLEKHAVGIEVCNAGWLTYKNGKFYSSFGTVIANEDVIEYVDKFKGQRFFHKYSDAQIETLRQLCVFFNEKYEIPLHYNEDMWDISENALKGEAGIYTHVSVRSDKTDCHPQPELIKMLKELTTPPPIEVEPELIVVGNTVDTDKIELKEEEMTGDQGASLSSEESSISERLSRLDKVSSLIAKGLSDDKKDEDDNT